MEQSFKLSKKSYSWDENFTSIDDGLYTIKIAQLTDDFNLSSSFS
jgi:hypothetical protein